MKSCSNMKRRPVTTLHNFFSKTSRTEFKKFFGETQKMCSDLNIFKPQLPRQGRPPSRYSGEGDCYKWNSAEEFFRSHYFALIDAAVNGLRATLNLDFRDIFFSKRS